MTLTARFSQALVYADMLHRGQTRKGSGVPYVSHLLRVAGLALEYGADEDEAIAALLHDAVEDQGGAKTLAEIRSRFGDRVAAIVDGTSDTDATPKPPWRERKERYIAHLVEASPSVRLVSACDKLDNVRSLAADYRRQGEAIWDRFNGGRLGTLWYHRAVLDSLKRLDASAYVEDLEREVAALEQLVVDRQP